MKNYLGNPLQIRGAEQYVLKGAAGEGMRFLCVRNGLGLEAFISLDRAGDLSRVTFKGDNMGYFAPCGYVHPMYYDERGAGFLKSFTAGFFTTCGLTSVGPAGEDKFGAAAMHGTISNTPAELLGFTESEDSIKIKLRVIDARIFSYKLSLCREYTFSYKENTVSVADSITNEGDLDSPFMLLYHCNMGYPLLSEKAQVKIPNISMKPRDPRAESQLASALKMEPPQAQYAECCYYYDMLEKNGVCRAGIYNEEIGKGVVLSYNKRELPAFTEWKQMGIHDYVLGLEPGNCNPAGRAALIESGELQMLKPQERAEINLSFSFVEAQEDFNQSF